MKGYELSDFEWGVIAPLLPNKPRGVPRVDDRRVLNGIFWVLRTGAPWRELPEEFGPWQTAYERQTRWSADGTWARLLAAAHADADARGELDWLVAADSSLVRVHQHGAAARRFGGNAATAPGPEPGAAPVTGGGVELQEFSGPSALAPVRSGGDRTR